VLQAFSSAIRRTFLQYFTRFQLTARLRGPSATAGLIVFIGEVALGYYGRRIIVTPFVNQQFSLQVVERGRAVQFVEQFTSGEDVTPAGRHSAHRRSDTMHTARPSTFFFTWPSTCFRGLPFICARSRSTRRTTCRIGRVRLLVCCRHLAAHRTA